MRRARVIVIMCALLCALPRALYPGEADLRKQINALYREGNSAALDDAVASFVNKFPRSEFAPEARMLAAALANAPNEALARYRQVRDDYPSYPRRSVAALRACEILYLSARWDELIEDARMGIALSPTDARSLRMKLLLARGLIQRERFDEARAVMNDVTANHHDYDGLAEALLLSSYIERRTTGYSRAYLVILKELVTGFPDSSSAAPGLYLLGRYYEKRGDYDRASSAMQDVVKRYPSSPEAGYARERIESYAPHDPKRVDYLPDESQVKSADVLDINPETRYPSRGDGGRLFAVALGPIYDKKDAGEIAALIKGEFSPVETVKVGGRYMIYVGRLDDMDAAIAVKTRLAEEYALNGGVVRIKKSGNKQYIYGE